ncbi:MAG: hypothetical protein IJ209_10415 [Bacteroidaceae bacterium]|nr:hypothetical protein [Bacteroidaceae bacterium]
MGATVGSKTVNAGTKFATGKTWANWVSDKIGLDKDAAEMTNPGMLTGGAIPFMTRGSRTLFSAGDQIVKDAAKDVFQYGPTTVAKNPRGWVRPYVDQVKNGWQGWRDMRLAQRNGAIQTDVNQPYFESFAKKLGKFDGSYPVGDNKTAEFYDYPEYNEGIGNGIYARFKRDDTPLFGVTQETEMPNTYLFHIGGGGKRGFQLSGEH